MCVLRNIDMKRLILFLHLLSELQIMSNVIEVIGVACADYWLEIQRR